MTAERLLVVFVLALLVILVGVVESATAAFIVANVSPVSAVEGIVADAVKVKQAEIHDFLAAATRPLRTK